MLILRSCGLPSARVFRGKRSNYLRRARDPNSGWLTVRTRLKLRVHKTEVNKVSPVPIIDLLVYPDDCDSFGHVNQATFLRLFEHARWQAVEKGPGMDVFGRTDAWPAVRKTTIEYFASAFPGDLLRFNADLPQLGRTSFTMHQTARRVADNTLIAEADFVFVCVSRDGTPTPVPEEIVRFLGG